MAKRPVPLALVFLAALVVACLSGCVSKPAGEAGPGAVTKSAVGQAASAKTRPPTNEELIAQAAAQPSAPLEGGGWKTMFDGRSLTGWRETDFGGRGRARCESGLLLLDMGATLSGVNWTNDAPRLNYEVALDAMRVQGSDFFCGLTFPVGESYCSLILGGWGGAVAGLSSLDGLDASENETTQYINFESERWYRVRLRVTSAKIEVWLDEKKIVDLPTAGRKISLRYGEIEQSKPLGLATWQTTAALREIKMRRLDAAAAPAK